MRNKLKGLLSKYRIPLITLCAIILLVCPLFFKEYSTDTYSASSKGMVAYASTPLGSGRPVTALVFYILGHISDGITLTYYVSFILSIACSFVAIYRLSCVYSRAADQRLSFLVAFVTVLNPLSVEYFLFLEKGMFFFGIMLLVFAFEAFTKFLDGKHYAIAISSVLIAISTLTYQSLTATFVPLVMTYILMNYKTIKKAIIDTLFAVLAYGVGMSVNLLFLLVFKFSNRSSGKLYWVNLKNTFWLAGGYTPLIYIGVLLLLFGICALFAVKHRHAVKSQYTLSLLIRCYVIFIATISAIFTPFLFVEPSAVWFPFRIIYPLGMLIGSYAIFFICQHKALVTGEQAVKAPRKKSIVAIIIVLLSVQLVFFQIMLVGRLINNRADEELCYKIEEQISLYERESGNKVKYISIYYDKSLTSRNPYVLKIGDSNVRAFSKPWSDVNCINEVLGTNYEKKDSPKYKSYFEKQDWTEFSKEQLIFDGEILHLCVY